jgi:hypothetical protein
MRFTVLWKSSAEMALASIWNSSANQRAVTIAADHIDQALRTEPVLRGETLSRTTRVMIERPLLVKYRVYEDDRIVRVLYVEELPAVAEPPD